MRSSIHVNQGQILGQFVETSDVHIAKLVAVRDKRISSYLDNCQTASHTSPLEPRSGDCSVKQISLATRFTVGTVRILSLLVQPPVIRMGLQRVPTVAAKGRGCRDHTWVHSETTRVCLWSQTSHCQTSIRSLGSLPRSCWIKCSQ